MVDHATAVQDIAERAYGDYRRWQTFKGTSSTDRFGAYGSMTTGVAALIAFGYAQDWKMLGGKQYHEKFGKIRQSLPDLEIDINRVPTKADVEKAREWQAKLRILLLQEFAPELARSTDEELTADGKDYARP